MVRDVTVMSPFHSPVLSFPTVLPPQSPGQANTLVVSLWRPKGNPPLGATTPTGPREPPYPASSLTLVGGGPQDGWIPVATVAW